MSALRLPKLPDRAPIKLTLHLAPELHAALERYGVLYEEAYGQSESIAELIPAMLANFLYSDRAFAKRQRGER